MRRSRPRTLSGACGVTMTPESRGPRADSGIGVVAILALTAFVVAGGIHYQSPMLVAIAAEFQVDAATAGWIPTLSFAGIGLPINPCGIGPGRAVQGPVNVAMRVRRKKFLGDSGFTHTLGFHAQDKFH